MCVCVEGGRERRCIIQCMPTAGKPGVEKTGFVYADAQTVHLARPICYTLFYPSIVKRTKQYTHKK